MPKSPFPGALKQLIIYRSFKKKTFIPIYFTLFCECLVYLFLCLSLLFQNYVLIVVILAFEAVVRFHQAQHYNKPGVERPPDSIVFLSIKRSNADDGLVSCFKYFINYGFYKFGLQVSVCVCVCVCVSVHTCMCLCVSTQSKITYSVVYHH